MDDQIKTVLDNPMITNVLFYPQTISRDYVPENENGEILSIPAGEGSLGAYYYHPHKNAKTMLFFHGNGELMTDYLYGFHQSIEHFGVNFLVVDYRGYGLSTGRPTLSKLLEDANSAWKYMTTQMGMAPNDIILMGRSLGSLAVLEIAANGGRDACGLIIESGIGRFDSWIDRMSHLLGQMGMDVPALKTALRQNFNQQDKIKSFKSNILVMHAPYDEIVPVENGKWLGQWGNPEKTTLHIFENGGHNDIQFVNKEKYFEVLNSFISEIA
jgi:uncharacterized protein